MLDVPQPVGQHGTGQGAEDAKSCRDARTVDQQDLTSIARIPAVELGGLGSIQRYPTIRAQGQAYRELRQFRQDGHRPL